MNKLMIFINLTTILIALMRKLAEMNFELTLLHVSLLNGNDLFHLESKEYATQEKPLQELAVVPI